jgi:hypothetical protein
MNKSNFASRILGALSIVALLACAQTSLAARLVDVSVLNRSTGERLTPYRYGGRLYVAGTPGDRYTVELRSLRGERVLTVISVDGVNVLTGQTAATRQSGYVIEGGQSYAISGWRKSMDDVAQFVFTELPNSYAALTGRPGNVGVIGVAVYREQRAAPPPVEVAPSTPSPAPYLRKESSSDSAADAARRASSLPAPEGKGESESGLSASTGSRGQTAADSLAENRSEQSESRSARSAEAEKKSSKLGTGHGAREYSPTRYTEFVRNSDTPDEIITIYYDSRSKLIARGIIPSPRLAEPSPFPAGAGFVPDPRG